MEYDEKAVPFGHSRVKDIAEDAKREREARFSIEKHEKPGVTAQDLRTQVLKHGIPMIEELQKSFHNNDTLSGSQLTAYEKLWPILESMIEKTTDLQIIEAENMSDLLKLVNKGKLSMKDAILASQLMQTKFEIEELPDILAKLDGLEGK